ncbi:MAG: kinase [Nitrospinota bacterium]|nr:MAG: kinase [Nitrospinota bacterium]
MFQGRREIVKHHEMIQALLSPHLYPDRPQRVEFRQTHISSLFFTDHYVYKVKKPVNFGFLDFSTLEARRFYCQEEVRLNRRLAPQVYLGVATIREKDGHLSWDGEGRVIDYAVVMRRLPAEKMLERLLEAGQVSADDWQRLAAYLAAFHQRAEQNAEITRYGACDVIREDWQENFAQTKRYVGETLTEETYHYIQQQVERFLMQRQGIFAWRQQTGRIRDCHGDLRVDHICLEPEIAVFDCIEFNKRFRYTDVAAEVAFLYMDLEARGFADAARLFLHHYLVASQDQGLPALLDFYACYRAYVRGKVKSFLLDDPEVSEEEKAEARRQATAYFTLARRYAERLRFPLLLITCGLTGTGKTTMARLLAGHLSLVLLRSDVLRKELAALPPAVHRYEEYGEGIYSESFTDQTYAALYREAERYLVQGESVILDASFLRRARREEARKLAERLGAAFYVIECVCPEGMVKERLEKRQREGRDASDGRWELFSQQKQVAEPVTEIAAEHHIRLDTTQPPAVLLTTVLQHLAGREGRGAVSEKEGVKHVHPS